MMPSVSDVALDVFKAHVPFPLLEFERRTKRTFADSRTWNGNRVKNFSFLPFCSFHLHFQAVVPSLFTSPKCKHWRLFLIQRMTNRSSFSRVDGWCGTKLLFISLKGNHVKWCFGWQKWCILQLIYIQSSRSNIFSDASLSITRKRYTCDDEDLDNENGCQEKQKPVTLCRHDNRNLCSCQWFVSLCLPLLLPPKT